MAADKRGDAPGWRRLRHGRHLLALCLLSVLVGACGIVAERPSTGGQLLIGGLTFQNQSRSMVTGMQLLVAETGEFVACGNIPPGGRCASTFPGRVYSGGLVEVSWNQGGQAWSTGMLRPAVTEEVAAAGVAEVQVVVVAPGSAGVLLVPASQPFKP